MPKCSECGAENEKGAKFCEECGKKLEAPKKTNKTLIFSVIGGLVLILVVISFIFINQGSQGKETEIDQEKTALTKQETGEEELQTQQAVCNKPYILVGTDCCLDVNDNKICDNDETTINKEPQIELKFVEGNPPDEVTDGGTFDFSVLVELTNKGNSNLEDVTVSLLGLRPEDFGKSSPDLKISVDTIKPLKTEYFRFDNLNYQGKLVGDRKDFTIRALADFEYMGKSYEKSKDSDFLVKHLVGSVVPVSKIVTVNILGKEGFNPEEITINPGDSVKWINKDTEDNDHVLTIQKGRNFLNSNKIKPNGEYVHTFDEAGDYAYWTIAYGVKGKIIVIQEV